MNLSPDPLAYDQRRAAVWRAITRYPETGVRR